MMSRVLDFGESGILFFFKRMLGIDPSMLLGMGDDVVAVIITFQYLMVMVVDVMVEGTHFQ